MHSRMQCLATHGLTSSDHHSKVVRSRTALIQGYSHHVALTSLPALTTSWLSGLYATQVTSPGSGGAVMNQGCYHNKLVTI